MCPKCGHTDFNIYIWELMRCFFDSNGDDDFYGKDTTDTLGDIHEVVCENCRYSLQREEWPDTLKELERKIKRSGMIP